MTRLFTPVWAAALASAVVAQSPIACFEFDGATLSSSQPAFAAVSDLTVSNDFIFGSGDTWLCLTTAWNNAGGQLSFTVTPNAGEAIEYMSFEWSAVTNNTSSSDSIASVTVLANGAVVGVVDPVMHNTTHVIDLTGVAALQGVSGPVEFVMDCEGNPNGNSSYEMENIKLFGDRCVLEIGDVTPAALPIVTDDCFTLQGDCFGLVTEVKFGGVSLPQCTPANWGQGCYEIVNATTLKVCPPLCEDVASYVIELVRANGESKSTNVELFLPLDGTLACPATHPAGTPLCLAVSTGQLPQPNVVFVILSPSPAPTIVPGIINMQLGNMAQEYICGPAHIGECIEECYAIPPGVAGATLYMQAIIWNPFLNTMPFPVSNRCETTFY